MKKLPDISFAHRTHRKALKRRSWEAGKIKKLREKKDESEEDEKN
jgi:hypothetical protein